jgi:hypothetical protein
MITRFEFGKQVYPQVVDCEEGYERVRIIFPDHTGDYVMAEIDSAERSTYLRIK